MWKPQPGFTDFLHIKNRDNYSHHLYYSLKLERSYLFSFVSYWQEYSGLPRPAGCWKQQTPHSTSYFGQPGELLPPQREGWGSRRLQLLLIERADTGTADPTFLSHLPGGNTGISWRNTCVFICMDAWSGHTAGITPRVAGDAHGAWLSFAAQGFWVDISGKELSQLTPAF